MGGFLFNKKKENGVSSTVQKPIKRSQGWNYLVISEGAFSLCSAEQMARFFSKGQQDFSSTTWLLIGSRRVLSVGGSDGTWSWRKLGREGQKRLGAAWTFGRENIPFKISCPRNSLFWKWLIEITLEKNNIKVFHL